MIEMKKKWRFPLGVRLENSCLYNDEQTKSDTRILQWFNKDLTFKAKDKDQTYKDKDQTLKAKDKD